ncbi:MAG: hypothetical protein M3395_00625 [Chloroflexota bacterium]|nr:hypothetical protein [Chloroflexota bacterium]
MSERIDDVRATSDALLADTQRLHALEVEKRGLDPQSMRFRDLSLQIEDLGTRIAALTSIEREVAEPLERPKDS